MRMRAPHQAIEAGNRAACQDRASRCVHYIPEPAFGFLFRIHGIGSEL